VWSVEQTSAERIAYSVELEKEEDKIQKSIFLCHSHESGNPGVKGKKKIDSRFHGNEINKRLIENIY